MYNVHSIVYMIVEKEKNTISQDRIISQKLMEKYIVDYSQFSAFKDITIYTDSLEEGLAYATSQKIEDIQIRNRDRDTASLVDFSFLENFDFLRNLSCIAALDKKSDISPLYHLTLLKSLAWAPQHNFELDLSRFSLLEKLSVGYNAKIMGWDKLGSLKTMFFQTLKMPNFEFFYAPELENLRVIKGKFRALTGLEKSNKIMEIFLQSCLEVEEIRSVIQQLPALEELYVERCKSLDFDQRFMDLRFLIQISFSKARF